MLTRVTHSCRITKPCGSADVLASSIPNAGPLKPGSHSLAHSHIRTGTQASLVAFELKV